MSDRPAMSPLARSRVQKALAAQRRLREASGEARACVKHAVTALLEEAVSYRDIARLLGLSHQRIAQITSEMRKDGEL